MRKVTVGILIGVGILVLVLAAGGTAFYVKVYAPIGSPLMVLSGSLRLEHQRLRQTDFRAPDSDELTDRQVGAFITVEQQVEDRLGARLAGLTSTYEQLVPKADARSRVLGTRTTLAAVQANKQALLDAKIAQIDALNQVAFSKAEFEWVRQRLYGAAGLRLCRLDTSELLSGDREAVVRARQIDAPGAIPDRNVQLARPHRPTLQRWLALAFFGI
jgi:hypothetical protein